MNFIKNNPFIALLVGVIFSCTLSFVLFIADPEESINEILINDGDTLWMLSDKYGGDMPKQDWISGVMVANNLNTQMIHAGRSLIIPDSFYQHNTNLDAEYAGDLQ